MPGPSRSRRRATPRPSPARGRRTTAPSRVLEDESGLRITTEPFGPGPDRVRQIEAELLQHPAILERLGRARWKLLSTRLLGESAEEKPQAPELPGRFLATIYDYTNNRTLEVSGSLRARRRVQIEESGRQPWPTNEEFADAVRILRRHPELGPSLRDGRFRPYRPMPPLVSGQEPDGRVERTIAVGLLPAEGERGHEIVGVNMTRRSVVRFENRAPDTAQAHNPICGLPDAAQPITSGTPGQAWVTVSQGGTVLWRFLAVRPAASSGTNGSGVELRFVDYRGKRVLYRAHVPILNIKYDNDACGPYRDRQDLEGMFQATGSDPVPGFRLCSAPAQTILDSGSDTGTFRGVAIYVQGQEVVFISEMEAGWYRYISQWRLAADGTIRARFGFSAVQSSCVCHIHHHHAYWRFDFDIDTPGNNRVREFNNPCLPGFCPSNWHDKVYEISRPRDPSRQRKWRIDNTVTGHAYDLIPGANDGVAVTEPDWPFPRGDVWILRYHWNEIDDGSVAWGPPYEAGVNSWVNGEPLLNQDVVIWYGAHFNHDISGEPPGTFGEWVGPDLVPVSW
jgi:hypothetical protein